MVSWDRHPDAEPMINMCYIVSVAQSGRAVRSKRKGCGFNSYSVRKFNAALADVVIAVACLINSI